MSTPDDGLARLADLLRSNGRSFAPDELGDLMAGIAAAPEGLAGAEWVELVTPDASEQVRAELTALRQSLASRADGLGDDGLAPAEAAQRLAALRAELKRRGLDGFIVPRADEHQGEYVPRAAQRLAWLTGFTGSAGWAVVLADKAAIFIDGRYTLQVRQQVDTALYTPVDYPATLPDAWLAQNLASGARFGFDAWLHGLSEAERLANACARAGATLVPVEGNPVDAVWTSRPPPPLSPVIPQPVELAGESSEDKRARIAQAVAEKGADAVLLSQPDSIAWLLNVRGGDVPRTPFPLSFALLRKDAGVDLFVDARKLPPATRAHLGNGVAVQRRALAGALESLGREGRTVWLDPQTAPRWAFDRLAAGAGGGPGVVRELDPVALPKACKNEVGWPACAPRIAATAPRSAATHFGWRARRQGGTDESPPPTDCRRCAKYRRDPRPELRHHLRRWSQAPSCTTAPARGARTLKPGELYLVDSGQPVSRRHHRCDAHPWRSASPAPRSRTASRVC